MHPSIDCVVLPAESEAIKRKIPIKVGVYSFELVNRAIISDYTKGYIKIIAADDDKNRLLGMRAIGPEASSIIGPAQLIISQDRSVFDLESILYPHPALSESVQECVRMFAGRSVMKPACFVKELRMATIHHLVDDDSSDASQMVCMADSKRAPVPTYS
jgi:dihydrolipoamide dehydrogenase